LQQPLSIWMKMKRVCYCRPGHDGLWSSRMFRTTVALTRRMPSPLVPSIWGNLARQMEAAIATAFVHLDAEETSVLFSSGPRWLMIV
jgi:hypothetical protein